MVYAFYLPEENKSILPQQLVLPYAKSDSKTKIYLLGYAKPLKYKTGKDGLQLTIPSEVIDRLKGQPAWTFQLKIANEK